MKTIKFALVVILAAVGFIAQAQVDFDAPQYAAWGPDAETREANMLKSAFLKDAMTNRDYDGAAAIFNELVNSCPEASEAVFARGVVLYRTKIARAKSVAEKKQMVDSLMIVHDLRLKYFADHPKRGAAYILDGKARDFYNNNKSDRAGIRKVFLEAIEANGDQVDAQFVLLYFQNLCEDYKMDEVMADDVMSEYDRLTPFFDKLESEETKYRDDFTTAFSQSGVATCENLESIFAPKLISSPEDSDLLKRCVRMMARLRCNSEFYVSSVERLYQLEPSAQAAMSLAAIYQSKGEYASASKYLRDALETEEDMEAREALNARIALIELAANNISAAAAAARESINTPDDTRSDNGIAYFVLAQCYASAAASCSGFEGQATYWAAYDTMASAIANFSADEADYKAVAQKSLATYPSYFPSKEECFFSELQEGSSYTIKCGVATGVTATVRVRK